MKKTYQSQSKYNYAFCIEDVNPDFLSMNFGSQIEHLRTINNFVETAEKWYVDCKGKGSMSAVKKWVKTWKPKQFYAKWQADSSHYKDDCVEIFVKDFQE